MSAIIKQYTDARIKACATTLENAGFTLVPPTKTTPRYVFATPPKVAPVAPPVAKVATPVAPIKVAPIVDDRAAKLAKKLAKNAPIMADKKWHDGLKPWMLNDASDSQLATINGKREKLGKTPKTLDQLGTTLEAAIKNAKLNVELKARGLWV